MGPVVPAERRIERPEGVLTNVQRQYPNVATIDTIGIRLIAINTDCFLKVLGSHSDQLYVTQ